MKPQFLKVTHQPEYSFSLRWDEFPYFFNVWHYHPELELVWIREGKGTLIIGDSTEHFQEGTMVLIGENLPHLWRSDEAYFQGTPGLWSRATVIHFRPEFLGQIFWNLPEMQNIVQCLKKAERGLRITDNTKVKIQELLTTLSRESTSDGERLIGLLQILNIISDSRDLLPLSTSVFSDVLFARRDAERINRVYTYVAKNFKDDITIEGVARVTNISPNSFCRFFKTKTGRTFSQFLLEFRIGQACKLLTEKQQSISEICYACGFNNLSNFNRHFRKIKKQTPTDFMRQYY